MKITNHKLLNKVKIIELDCFQDHRGEYIETYNEKIYFENGIETKFIQDDISISKKNVLRGIHGDPNTAKLVSCLYGEFLLVVVDCDRNSSTYLKWFTINLSRKNRLQVFIPKNYGNGHLVLSDEAIFHYKQNTMYQPSNQFTFLWNDERLKINWPISNPILSKRDKDGYF